MKELISAPQNLWVLFLITSTSIPILIFVIKWFWKLTSYEVKGAIVSELKQDNETFKAIMNEQLSVVKDTVEVVKDSIIVMKKDNELGHTQNKQMLDVMMLHIDELKHVKGQVDSHEKRIIKIEKG